MSTSVIDLLSELVKIPSVSSVSNSTIISKIAEWFSEYEKEFQDWERQDGVMGKNLIVKIPGADSSRSLVFVCHMDTVPTSTEWKTDPFTITENEGKLFGLGSCDTKGGTAALIEAVLALENKPSCDLYLVFSGDEEVTSFGVHKLKEKITFRNPSFVFIEPTDNKVLISQRSALQIDVITRGTSRHGSYALPAENEKNSAIFKMSKVIQALIEDAFKNAQETDEILGTNTQNLGQIEGGTARNVIPDLCTLKIDRRILPKKDLDAEVKRIQEKVKAQDPDAEVVKVIAHPGFDTDKNSKLVITALSGMKAGGFSTEVGGFQAWSEAGLFNNFKDVIILGPGSISQAHVANEFVLKEDLDKYVSIFRYIIEKY